MLHHDTKTNLMGTFIRVSEFIDPRAPITHEGCAVNVDPLDVDSYEAVQKISVSLSTYLKGHQLTRIPFYRELES